MVNYINLYIFSYRRPTDRRPTDFYKYVQIFVCNKYMFLICLYKSLDFLMRNPPTFRRVDLALSSCAFTLQFRFVSKSRRTQGRSSFVVSQYATPRGARGVLGVGNSAFSLSPFFGGPLGGPWGHMGSHMGPMAPQFKNSAPPCKRIIICHFIWSLMFFVIS